jgi:hypothetical protein
MGYKSALERNIYELRDLSRQFGLAMQANDDAQAGEISQLAWPLIRGVVGEIRNMREHRGIRSQDRTVVGRWLEPHKSELGFKDALDKVIHHDPAQTDFRLDGSKHYLTFSGQRNCERWTVEIAIQEFLRACEAIRSESVA